MLKIGTTFFHASIFTKNIFYPLQILCSDDLEMFDALYFRFWKKHFITTHYFDACWKNRIKHTVWFKNEENRFKTKSKVYVLPVFTFYPLRHSILIDFWCIFFMSPYNYVPINMMHLIGVNSHKIIAKIYFLNLIKYFSNYFRFSVLNEVSSKHCCLANRTINWQLTLLFFKLIVQ